MVDVVDLTELPLADVRSLLASDTPVWIFVNPVEFHGPHLSLHTDELIARGLASDIHARLSADRPFLVGARLEMGADPTPGPGSRPFSFEAVRDAVVDVTETLADLGARKLVAMTFHGSPLHEHALEAGCVAFRRRGGRALNPMNLLLDLLVDVDVSRFRPAVAHIPDAAEAERVLADLACDFHAGFMETSLALHYAPTSVSPRHRELPPCPPLPLDPVLARMERGARRMRRWRLADELLVAARAQGWGTLRPFPGYTSAPHLASRSAGAYFASQLVDLYAPSVRGVLDGSREAPAPVMPWILWATLGGRMEAAKRIDLAHVSG